MSSNSNPFAMLDTKYATGVVEDGVPDPIITTSREIIKNEN